MHQIDEIIGRHCNTIKQIFHRLCALSFHVGQGDADNDSRASMGNGVGGAARKQAANTEGSEGISHTMLWLFVLRTGILHTHENVVTPRDVDAIFKVVADDSGREPTRASIASASSSSVDAAAAGGGARASSSDTTNHNSQAEEHPEELMEKHFVLFLILLAIKIYAPRLYLHAKSATVSHTLSRRRVLGACPSVRPSPSVSVCLLAPQHARVDRRSNFRTKKGLVQAAHARTQFTFVCLSVFVFWSVNAIGWHSSTTCRHSFHPLPFPAVLSSCYCLSILMFTINRRPACKVRPSQLPARSFYKTTSSRVVVACTTTWCCEKSSSRRSKSICGTTPA